MIIRKATINDAEAISFLIRKVTDHNPNNYSPEQIDAWKAYNTPDVINEQLNDRLIFCAIKDNTLVGTIALKNDSIHGFYVEPSVSKTGIGSQLIAFIEKRALKNNLQKLKLTATPSALEFYKKKRLQSY